MVLEAGRASSPQADAALAKLCQTYWYPLYCYVRGWGHSAEDAQDLTQGFFARLIEKKFLEIADREKGKFRSFLLVALKRFLANEWDKANREKRGGGQQVVSLDEENSETRFQAEPADNMTPEKAYERRWALTLLEQARERLREEWRLSGRERQFDLLKGFLSGEGESDYGSAAASLGVSHGAVKVTVHRLRQRYREVVRAEIAQTVANPVEVDDEMQHLLAALG